MDSLIERNLKNWAVRQPSPVDGRERLLQAAKVPPPVGHFVIRLWLDKLFSYSLPQLLFEDEAVPVWHTQFRIWSYYITSSIRFVA
jgi:hypothetical protein